MPREKKKEINPLILLRKIKIMELYGSDDTYIADQTRKSSIYKLEEELQASIYNLSHTALKIFFYISQNLYEDEVSIDYKDATKELGIGEKAYYLAIQQLITLQVIFKKSTGKYWVSPFIMFAGNRGKVIEAKYGKEYVDVVNKISLIKRTNGQ
jgi:hypothetical protein